MIAFSNSEALFLTSPTEAGLRPYPGRDSRQRPVYLLTRSTENRRSSSSLSTVSSTDLPSNPRTFRKPPLYPPPPHSRRLGDENTGRLDPCSLAGETFRGTETAIRSPPVLKLEPDTCMD